MRLYEDILVAIVIGLAMVIVAVVMARSTDDMSSSNDDDYGSDCEDWSWYSWFDLSSTHVSIHAWISLFESYATIMSKAVSLLREAFERARKPTSHLAPRSIVRCVCFMMLAPFALVAWIATKLLHYLYQQLTGKDDMHLFTSNNEHFSQQRYIDPAPDADYGSLKNETSCGSDYYPSDTKQGKGDISLEIFTDGTACSVTISSTNMNLSLPKILSTKDTQ